jgi:hypothetical protein
MTVGKRKQRKISTNLKKSTDHILKIGFCVFGSHLMAPASIFNSPVRVSSLQREPAFQLGGPPGTGCGKACERTLLKGSKAHT